MFPLFYVLIFLIPILIAYFKWAFSYWKRRGVATYNVQIPFGNSGGFVRTNSFGEEFRNIYNEFRSQGLAYGGGYFFTKPLFIPVDPELIKCIMQKDFQHFMNHGSFENVEVDPLSGHLFSLENEKWRNLRVKLTPTFTSGKMKMMFETLANCTDGLVDNINKNVTDDDKITDGNIRENGLSINELAAQAFVFFIAGFETSSTTMTFALYEIGLNQDIQKKMREEIKTVLKKHAGKISYDAVMDMHYMDKVINETLRKYPPLALLFRECNKDYKVPDSKVVIQNGTRIAIPVLGLHYDHEYYPNPTVFDPERFSEANKSSRPVFTWLPFGEGPRICIGMRFGLMQTKVGLASMLNEFEISINKKTSVPLILDKYSFITSAEGGVWLDFKKIVNS